mmetsp:Transcript_15283/g.18772  ORF Transcript_15283/g.18772 Transcript_15283/m.18772 type:complete len:108 (+) Transcript_15283:52-375(+)
MVLKFQRICNPKDGEGQKKTRKYLKISSLEDRVKELRKGVKAKRGEPAGKNVKIHEGQFQKFRRELEQQSNTAPALATSQQATSISPPPSSSVPSVRRSPRNNDLSK